jgi:hypothetical protein
MDRRYGAFAFRCQSVVGESRSRPSAPWAEMSGRIASVSSSVSTVVPLCDSLKLEIWHNWFLGAKTSTAQVD